MTTDLYQARTKAPDPGKPLVFVFHGTGGHEGQFFDLVQTLVPGAGVIAPRGDVSEHGALRFFKRTGEGVYDMDDLKARTARMTDFIKAHLSATPNTPVFAFGYSNGANILASVMLESPELFDRVGLLHPLIPWTPAPQPGLKGRKVFVSAGQHDPITPWSASQALMDWLKAQGAEVTEAVHEGGHELREMEIRALQQFLSA
ncbi:MAG: alpha/beta hydrolase [Pseudomonadota bacterium]